MNLSKNLTDKLQKVGITKITIFALAAIVVGGCGIAYCVNGNNDNVLPPDTNEQMAIDQLETEVTLSENTGLIVSDLNIPYVEMGYETIDEYWDALESKRNDAKGMTDAVIAKYGNIFDESELKQLRKLEEDMLNTPLISEYDEALAAFNKIVDANKPKPKPVQKPVEDADKPSNGGGNNNGGGSGSSGGGKPSGGYNIPYNFKQMGVIYDSDWRYTWYSSRVLYHYMTPQWTVGSDGIYRDSSGRVVVACDAYPHGTVLQTEYFGTCIVLDCGVGRNDTLDVYVAW